MVLSSILFARDDRGHPRHRGPQDAPKIDQTRRPVLEQDQAVLWHAHTRYPKAQPIVRAGGEKHEPQGLVTFEKEEWRLQSGKYRTRPRFACEMEGLKSAPKQKPEIAAAKIGMGCRLFREWDYLGAGSSESRNAGKKLTTRSEPRSRMAPYGECAAEAIPQG